MAIADPTSRKELVSLLAKAIKRNDELEGQVRDLEFALQFDQTVSVQAAFGVTEALAQILVMLADGKPKNKERLHAALYYKRPSGDAPDIEVMTKMVSVLRKQVEPFGIEIDTLHGTGYRLVRGIEVLRAVMEGKQP